MRQVGDKVRITACHWGHGLEIGSIQEIGRVDGENDYFIYEGKNHWAVGDDEIELIEPVK